MSGARTCIVALAAASALGWFGVGAARAQRPSTKVDIVSVSGCLRQEAGDVWMVVNATEPVKSNANAPTKADIPTSVLPGKGRFRLIGVGEFDLPSHKDHFVVVKGLLIAANPVSRLNITSIVTALPAC